MRRARAFRLVLLVGATVWAIAILANYIGMPVGDATGTIAELRDGFGSCDIEIRSDTLGVVTDHERHHACPTTFHVGQTVAFQYRQGRFYKSTLLWKGFDSLKAL